jgi:hypothetical protein
MGDIQMEKSVRETENNISTEVARAIAKEAYIYGFPIVGNYLVLHTYFVNNQSPEFKAPWNQICNIPRVFTSEDKAVKAPNSDTPYSILGMDLRTEPLVITVPPIEKQRYFSIQLIDFYTFNFDYIGSRTTGNDGGSFLIAGPGWKGKVSKGIKKVIRSETELALAVFRTQLFNPGDLDNVKNVQSGYKVQVLSEFLDQPKPKAAPAIDFIEPLTLDSLKTSLDFFKILNFGLKFCPIHPSEKELMTRFARINVGAGRIFDAGTFPPEITTAIGKGITDAWAEFADFKQKRFDTKEVVFGDLYGTRDDLKNNFFYRMVAFVLGNYGNSKQEAMYPMYTVDSEGNALVGANHYTLRFAPDQLPPVNAFWSLTMYGLPENLLVSNPLNRYLINSPMLPQLKRDADGGLTILVQHESPGKEESTNWLPAPKGPFQMALRLYWPKEEATEGRWNEPKVVKG